MESSRSSYASTVEIRFFSFYTTREYESSIVVDEWTRSVTTAHIRLGSDVVEE